MRLVSVTRILNDDDIAEAFVRHNSTFLSQMLFLDNGSTDRTLEILKSLQAEDFPLTVFQNTAVSFDEIAVNTWSYQLASQILGADWVVFLDADEFIATPGDVRSLLPERADALAMPLVNYGQTQADDVAEIIIPLRQRHRFAAPTGVDKLILRGGLGEKVVIRPGNHGADLAGVQIPAARSTEISLAHYPRRGGAQVIQKIISGWLKAVAAGEAVTRPGHSSHYRSPFETMRDKPWEIFRNPEFFAAELELAEAIDAPLAYRGGALRYTRPVDEEMKAVSAFLHFTERLARQHGRLLDQSAQARALVEGWNAKRDFLF